MNRSKLTISIFGLLVAAAVTKNVHAVSVPYLLAGGAAVVSGPCIALASTIVDPIIRDAKHTANSCDVGFPDGMRRWTAARSTIGIYKILKGLIVVAGLAITAGGAVLIRQGIR